MAGGSGERFWPLSRQNRPKQLLKLDDDNQTMLSIALNRISNVISAQNTFIITAEHLIRPIRDELDGFPPENVIAEPAKRNTAACLAYAVSFIRAKFDLPDDKISVAVLTADHRITPDYAFASDVNMALDFVEKDNAICTLGIQPTRPDTGYGYIETEISDTHVQIQKAIRFHEKPNLERALEYLSKGNFLWNAGMFFWRVDTFINEMIHHYPEVGNYIIPMSQLHIGYTSIALDTTNQLTKDLYCSFPDKSIDYALMEKSKSVYVCKASFSWDDIGSWDSLIRSQKADSNTNIINGKNVIILDCNNTTVFNSVNDKMLVGAIGLKDIIVVTTEDAILVCNSSQVQDVKNLVSEIKNRNLEDWL